MASAEAKATVARMRGFPAQLAGVRGLYRAAPPGLKDRILEMLRSTPAVQKWTDEQWNAWARSPEGKRSGALVQELPPPARRPMQGPYSKRGPGQDARGYRYYNPRYDSPGLYMGWYPGPKLVGKRTGGRTPT